MLAQVLEARLSINLGRAEMLVPQKLLHLVNRHPCIQQQGGHARPEPVRGDVLHQASALRRVVNNELDSTWGIAGMAVALEQVDRLPPTQMGAHKRVVKIEGQINLQELGYSPDKFWPGALKSVTWNGKLYGVPTNNETHGFIWNKEIFQKAGLIWTNRLPTFCAAV